MVKEHDGALKRSKHKNNKANQEEHEQAKEAE